MKNLPGGQQNSSWNFSEDTVVSVLNTINEVIAENLEAAKKLRETQGIEKLVLINKSGWAAYLITAGGIRADKGVAAEGLSCLAVLGFYLLTCEIMLLAFSVLMLTQQLMIYSDMISNYAVLLFSTEYRI